MEIYIGILYAQRFQTILKVVSFVGQMIGSQDGTVPSVTLKPSILFSWRYYFKSVFVFNSSPTEVY